MFEERPSHLKLSSSPKKRTIAAPWFLDGFGKPVQLTIPPGAKACYDPKNKILHVRDNEKGIARTVTPSVWVTLDYDQEFHEVEFLDPANPHHTLASIYINQGVLGFDDKKRFEFSNTLMFECFRRILASPAFNPWTRLPEIQDDQSYHHCDLTTGKIWLNPDVDASHDVDEQRSPLISFSFETSMPLEGWNKDTREDDILPPGFYGAEIIKADRRTGDPETVRAEGWSADRSQYCDFHIPFAPLHQLIEEKKIESWEAVFRVPFDPRVHTDMALKAVEEPVKKGLFGGLFGRPPGRT